MLSQGPLKLRLVGSNTKRGGMKLAQTVLIAMGQVYIGQVEHVGYVEAPGGIESLFLKKYFQGMEQTRLDFPQSLAAIDLTTEISMMRLAKWLDGGVPQNPLLTTRIFFLLTQLIK